MPYIGNQPAPQNVGSDAITDGSIVNADINASAAIAVDVVITDTSGGTSVYLVKGATVPVGGALVPVGGDQKIVLETTDIIKVTSDTASSADVIVSVLEQS